MTIPATHAVVCVTPNPALDRTLEVPGLKPGTVMRTASSRVVAGGKGLNVARALAALGTETLCMGPLGGASGRWLEDLAAAEGLRAAWTRCAIETRSCLILVDTEAKAATVINEAGPSLSLEDWRRVCSEVLDRSAGSRAVCVSGSLPPGLPPGEHAELCRSLVGTGAAPWVDTSGTALSAALAIPGIQLKINREEAEQALGRSLGDEGACAAAARRLVNEGVKTVALTLGDGGAVLASEEGCWRAAAPVVETSSAVASGDSFLAGLVAATISGRRLPEALRWGVAAGAANAAAGGGARFSRDQFDAMLRRVETRTVPD